MKDISSFTIDHFKLEPGLYLSREDHVGDATLKSYDLRIIAPNKGPVMNTGEMHTIEHLVATFLRNDDQFSDQVIYFGPMGCRTGFYLILTDKVEPSEVLSLLKRAFQFSANFEGEIPGATAKGCGNYLDHNLPMAKYFSAEYLKTLKGVEDLTFSY